MADDGKEPEDTEEGDVGDVEAEPNVEFKPLLDQVRHATSHFRYSHPDLAG
jgi:hypothetical protein